ncbi:MAG: hypothetical protein KDD42_05090 [Bdellovibrionales bacterium]|nr:hypothetical protein [Bdellovibrionales bacterium]
MARKDSKSRIAAASSKLRKRSEKKLGVDLKYKLYEASVQDPPEQTACVARFYNEIFDSEARVVREDFCGTFYFSCEWVKRNSRNQAICLDINEEPLGYGFRKHFKQLSSEEQTRITVLNQNVMEPTDLPCDIIVAGNFSFYTLKERVYLKKYLEASYSSLAQNGILVLEMVGGAGFEETPQKEQRSYRYEKGAKKGEKWFTYQWEQRSFNPVARNGLYYINFKMSDGTLYKEAFEYDWRVWTVPEVRDCVAEAGFDSSVVYWDDQEDDDDSSEAYHVRESADNDNTWLCYVVAIKR